MEFQEFLWGEKFLLEDLIYMVLVLLVACLPGGRGRGTEVVELDGAVDVRMHSRQRPRSLADTSGCMMLPR